MERVLSYIMMRRGKKACSLGYQSINFTPCYNILTISYFLLWYALLFASEYRVSLIAIFYVIKFIYLRIFQYPLLNSDYIIPLVIFSQMGGLEYLWLDPLIGLEHSVYVPGSSKYLLVHALWEYLDVSTKSESYMKLLASSSIRFWFISSFWWLTCNQPFFVISCS